MFKVTVKDGASHKHIAVSAGDALDAERKAVAAGFRLSGADTYAITAYGVRFCDVSI